MAASTTDKSKAEKDSVDAMFDGEPGAVEDDDFDDLLDDVEEDDSEGWVPKEKDEGISGVVVKIGSTKSDFADDGDPLCPTVTLECKDPDNPGKTIKWRVIGYGAVLRREIEDANPQVGDRMAVKYFGEKVIRNGKYKGKMYKHFGVAVRKAPAAS